MINLFNTHIESLSIHRVGNKNRNESVFLSEQPYNLNDEIVPLLKEYFFKSFREKEENYFQFAHEVDLEYNDMFNLATEIFTNPSDIHEVSKKITTHLFEQSNHPHIKNGEVYVAYLTNLNIDNNVVDAIGIFKSETKETFLKVFPHGQSWEVIQEEGININKLDKGCLVFKNNKQNGYIVCVVDATNKQSDAQYWVNNFLQVEPNADSYHNTNNYLGLCKQFITNEYAEKFEVNKSEQIDMLNRSIDYFKTKEQFSLQQFTEEVIHHPEVAESFMEYKNTYSAAKNFAMEDEFDIHLSAVKKQAKVFKTVLKLDKNFHIYIHGRRDLIEKGYDEISGKYYYKLFFEEEA